MEFFSGSNATPLVSFDTERPARDGYVTLAGGGVGNSFNRSGYALWAFGGGGSAAYSGSVQVQGLVISGARYEVFPQNNNNSIIRETQLLIDDSKNRVSTTMTPGRIHIINDSIDTDHSSGGAQVYRIAPGLQVHHSASNNAFGGAGNAGVLFHNTTGFSSLEVSDENGVEGGTLLVDVEHNGNVGESLTGISAGPIGQVISVEGAGATEHNNGAIGLAINMDDSYDDALTAALWCDNQIVTTHEVTAYYSDERLKDFEGKISNALEKVSQINGYYFRRNKLANSIGYSGNKLEVGVNAQEVKKIMPEVVKKAGVKPHLQPKDQEPYMTVDYARLTPLLIESIKELKAEIDELKKKLGE